MAFSKNASKLFQSSEKRPIQYICYLIYIYILCNICNASSISHGEKDSIFVLFHRIEDLFFKNYYFYCRRIYIRVNLMHSFIEF